MVGARPVGAPVLRRVQGGPGPSIINLPRAGCWRFTLRWARSVDELDPGLRRAQPPLAAAARRVRPRGCGHRTDRPRQVLRSRPGRARRRHLDPPRRDRRPARPERRRQVDDDRHAARPARPDAGTVSVFGRGPRPARSRRAGRRDAPDRWPGRRPVGARGRRPRGLALPRAATPSTSCSSCRDRASSPTAARRSSPAARRSGCSSPRARARPDLLVLDEPTVAMDVEARRAFWASMRDFAARGKTVLFATHYLEEADAYADRVVLMARGRSSPTGRRPRSRRRSAPHDPRDAAGRRPRRLAALPGVRSVERRGETVILPAPTPTPPSAPCSPRYPGARDLEVTGAGLEDAFLRADRRDHPDEHRADERRRRTSATS